MSETDKYEAGVLGVVRTLRAALHISPTAGKAAAAYLREHFVTREEFDGACRDIDSLRDGINGFAEEVVALTAERDRLRRALVEAAIPLEAMLISGATQGLWQGLQQGIEHGAECCRQALNPEDV